MAKAASIGVKVNEDLKNEAQAALNEMGIPMSLVVCLEGDVMTVRLESGEHLRCPASCSPIMLLEQGRTEHHG